MTISDYAQESLGQVAFVELPSLGAEVKQEGRSFLLLPCVRCTLTINVQRTLALWRARRRLLISCVVATLCTAPKPTLLQYAPISGKVVEVNEELNGNPGLINKDAEGAGTWLPSWVA